MMRHLLILLPILFSWSHYGAAVERTKEKESSYITDFQYSDTVGERYLTLTILHDGKIVRTLHGERERGGAFERESLPRLSPDNNFVYLSQIESAELETPNGAIISENAYCSLVNVRNGCIVARETGEFCGGTFTSDGKWKNSVYPDFNLAGATPSASAYVEGKLKPSGSPETSFENLLACDPPNNNNADAYRIIAERNIFDLDSTQRDFFIRTFKETH